MVTGDPLRHPVEPAATGWSFGAPPDWPDDDLVGVGADLEPGTVLAAYRRGLFPMPTGQRRFPIAWWSPRERGVLELDGLHVSRSLRRSCRDLEIRVDTAFDAVIEACADPRRPHGWIDNDVMAAYRRLHELGWAHSVEAWRDGRLVGGLYGLALGGLFAGESMFHCERDASKAALVGLVALLREASDGVGPRLIDVQWQTDHLASLGVRTIDRAAYLRTLPGLLTTRLPPEFGG